MNSIVQKETDTKCVKWWRRGGGAGREEGQTAKEM